MNIFHSELFKTISIGGNESKLIIRIRYIVLARQYYPDKYFSEYIFFKKISKNKFKNILNTYNILKD